MIEFTEMGLPHTDRFHLTHPMRETVDLSQPLPVLGREAHAERDEHGAGDAVECAADSRLG